MYQAKYSHWWEKMVSEYLQHCSKTYMKLESGTKDFYRCYNDCLKEEPKSYKMQRQLHNQAHYTYSKNSSKDT